MSSATSRICTPTSTPWMHRSASSRSASSARGPRRSRNSTRRCARTCSELPRDAKTEIEEPAVSGHEAVAVRDAGDLRVADPGPAAGDPQATIAALARSAVRGRALVVRIPAVLHPLPDVADHIVQAEAVRVEAADRRGLFAAPAAAGTVEIGAVGARRVAPGIPRGRSSAGRVFPLGFREEPIGSAGLLGEPRYIGLGVLPAHVDDRPPPAA